MLDIIYVLKDPTTPNLVVPVDLPPKPGILPFKVDGFRGATTSMYTMEHEAAMCHYSIVQAINLMNKVLQRSVENWSSINVLSVWPRAGKQFNAYYDRSGLKFFYSTDPVLRQVIYSANSSDVILHETGHALLDAIRPDLFNVQAMEIWGFHESFGDIHAMINMLQHDFLLDYVLLETGGNLAQSNAFTKLAEEMGHAIYNVTGGRAGTVNSGLRNAFNQFVYAPPETLPRDGTDNQLTSEPHSFSRVFTGAWYDLLVAIYEDGKKTLSPKDALINARDVLTTYTYNAIPNAPATIRFYDGFAKVMLVQDKLNNYKYNVIMNEVFIKRNILKQVVKPMVALSWSVFKNTVEPNDQVLDNPKASSVRNKNISTLSLPNFMINVEVPNDIYFEFDHNGNCIDTISSLPTELVDHAHHCVDFLLAKGLIRPDSSTPFEIDASGNLIRSHFSGCFK